MGRRTASYLLSASFAYWHQSCDIHQINRAVSVSPPRLQLLRHKASSEMFINIALLPPEWEPCGLCSQGVYLFAPTCEQVNNNIAAHSFFPSQLRFNRVESQSLVHTRHSSVIMGDNCENCDLWRASDVSDRCFFFFFCANAPRRELCNCQCESIQNEDVLPKAADVGGLRAKWILRLLEWLQRDALVFTLKACSVRKPAYKKLLKCQLTN